MAAAKWWMTIAPEDQEMKLRGEIHRYRVDYSIPDAGTHTVYVDEQMARMLERAKLSGEEKARESMRRSLGL